MKRALLDINRMHSFYTAVLLADLGVMLGVYLPTIQHILGVTMFIRLFWVVGIAGVGQTFVLLFLCCLCVSSAEISLIMNRKGILSRFSHHYAFP
uniref:Uncharacterized protein n=1 Tax=Parascaris equorum TaxID=6256 RepID=A0A914RPZ6_PAREQ